MKEDILERVIQEIKTYGDLDGIEDIRPLGKALENLIARNKELEEENKSLTDSYLIQKDLINEEILRERKQFYEGELYTAKQLKNIERDRNKYYIHKSKVREKIGELEKEYEEYKNGQEWEIQDDIQAQINILQELLEERN